MGGLTIGIVVPASSTSSAASAKGLEPEQAREDWRSARELQAAAATLDIEARLLTPSDFLQSSGSDRASACDRLLVCASGPEGGSGAIHAAARAAGLPVLGPSAETIAAAFDKVRARERLAHCNLPVPTSRCVAGLDRLEDVDRLGWPCLLKPRFGAGGRGIVRLDSAAAIREALLHVASPSAWLLERELLAREVSVVILRGEVLGMIEVERELGPEGALTRSMTCPPTLSPTRTRGLANLALRAAECLGVSEGPTRVDLLCTPRDNELVLEVEPLPALHRDSIVARVARAEGLSAAELLARVLVASDRARTFGASAQLSA